MRVTRDVKGFSETSHKRLLRCLMLRNHNEQPLFANSVLFLLAIALADRVFQDYAILEKRISREHIFFGRYIFSGSIYF